MTDGRCPVSHADLAPHRLDPTGARQHAVNEELRARGAAVPVLLPGDVPGYAITRHEELKDFVTHPDVAKNACHFAALQRDELPPGWPMRTFATVRGMITADGEDHKRLRSLVTRAFTPRRVEALRPVVHELTGTLLDRLAGAVAADPDGVADLRRHFALPLPMSVICGSWASTTSTRTGCTSCPTRSSPPTPPRNGSRTPTVRWSRSSARWRRPGRRIPGTI